MVELAGTFVDLQEERHRADYDLSQTFGRTEVVSLCKRAEDVFAALDALRSDPVARLFAVLLLTGEELIRRR